ncbi:adenosylcobinamide amidohydrolase [Rhodobacter capsulatus]|uniref:Adenosylcobinamide amidohydrolase n=1 Tax=Rhodobacter capsulatus TaxID=1061 RepID=A0A4U1JRY4_RHOCA|nr:adenosylcobinamide amidohydrolase [Rhodobacter capsulatus]TKD21750.1 adenosylcobinamide amidohydrolase [Rhodobacter capsulatus]
MTPLPLQLDPPWLVVDLGAALRVLSFAPHRPGLVTARQIVWREVRNADLPPGLAVGPWFAAELAGRGLGDAVAMLTSRDIRRVSRASCTVADWTVEALATVGLGNAEAVGRRLAPRDPEAAGYGTINLALRIAAARPGHGLSVAAQIEALSLAAQARTAAVLALGLDLPTGRATGTGTDCIAIAASPGREAHAGLHTALGEAIGRAVLEAVGQGGRDWMQERREPRAGLGPLK